MTTFNSFSEAINFAFGLMRTKSILVHRDKWQGINVSRKPDAATHEIHHFTMKVPMIIRDLSFYREEIKPNLPWADDHFLERVSGNPLNPGTEWRNWPWGVSADRSRVPPQSIGDPGHDKVFDHTYAQRYFPKYAGRFPGGILGDTAGLEPHKGIYFPYGDLDDVVTELYKDPTTRQAILPVFFPEDTGCRPGRRKPCSLFYHFMRTANSLDISYQLRSCDLVHHMRDDIYLTVRLLLWVLDQLRNTDSVDWRDVLPGTFVLQIANLHCFRNDMIRLQDGAHIKT